MVTDVIYDISIPLDLAGEQPNAYGVSPAVSEPVEAGGLVGDTRRGGSVNFERVTLIPHCNGTHTECVGHITHERISVQDCLLDVIVSATLISVEPASVGDDYVLSKAGLTKALGSLTLTPSIDRASALVVRTLPNDDTKLTRHYGEDNIPPYFTAEAMQYIVECGFRHLLVDLPSIDRIFDDGKLINHRIFWNVAGESFEVNSNTRVNSTVTELIYVPNEVEDGEYSLNIQIAPFRADASPSRPMLFRRSDS